MTQTQFPMSYASPSGRANIPLTLRENPSDGAERLDLLCHILEAAGAELVSDHGDGSLTWIELDFEGARLTLYCDQLGGATLCPFEGSTRDGGYTAEEFRPVVVLAAKLAGPDPYAVVS